MYVCMYVCMHVCMYVYICMLYVCMYVCMYVTELLQNCAAENNKFLQTKHLSGKVLQPCWIVALIGSGGFWNPILRDHVAMGRKRCGQNGADKVLPIFRKEQKQQDMAKLDPYETLACPASFGLVPSYKLELRPGSNPTAAYINKAVQTVQRSSASC